MKIGILETGKPPRRLMERFGRYDGMFRALLGPDFDYRTYDVQAGELPAEPEEQDAYIVTGSPAAAYDEDEWIRSLKEFLQRAKGRAKLVGICFGHQIMAEAFGGRVEKSSKGWGIGLHSYEVREPAPWMDEAGPLAIPVSHQDQIVEAPPHTSILAASEFSPFGMLSYEDQPAMSMQCHPEFEPDFARALLESRRDRIDDIETALESLYQPTDRLRMGRWIRTFLTSS